MKKIKKICTLLLVILSIFVITGCEQKKEEQKIAPSATYGKIENLKIIKSKRIEDNSVIFLLKNKDDYMVRNVTVTIEFWKKAEEATDSENSESNEEAQDSLTGSSSKFFSLIEPNQTVPGQISNGKREWDYYKIFVEETPDSKTDKIASEYNNLLFDDNTILTLPEVCTEEIQENCVKEEEMPELSDKMNLVIKNASDKKLNYYQIGIVFYQGNEIVGYSETNGNNLPSKKMRNDTATFPINQLTRKKINFDNYTIYKIIAYYNNIQ